MTGRFGRCELVLMRRAVAAAMLVVAACLPAAVFAQDATASAQSDGFVRRWFQNRPWFEPLVAEPRAAHVSLIGLARSRGFPFMSRDGARRVWEIHLGREIPFVLREKGTSGDATIAPRGWGFGVWFPVSVHFIQDFKDEGHPIVNADYRVGAAFKVAHGMAHRPDDRIFWKLYVGHESSHVGDEFLLNAQARSESAFSRVDVTYQFIEAGTSWDHAVASGRGRITVRATASHTFPYKGRSSFYVPALLDGTPLTPSVRHFEPAIGVEYQPLGTSGVGVVLSMDLRRRTILDFEKPRPDAREDAQWSLTMAATLRPLHLRARGTPELIVKAYRGVNPNGQFRTQRDYWLFGVGMHVRV